MTKEIWKPIECFEGYFASDKGRIKSPFGNILKGSPDNYGYLNTSLKKNNKFVCVKIARIIAKTFIPNPENKPCVDHINTVKTDNRVANLRWVTYKENMRNPLTYIKVLSEVTKPERLKNLDHTGQKLTEEHKKKIGLANKGRTPSNIRAVKCIETGECYKSITEA